MSLTAGAISLVSKTQDTANLSATAASGGTGPYTQQWYRSTTSGFSPGGGNILSGKTALTLADTSLVPGTTYYYKVVYTDTGDSNTTITATQLAVTTDIASPSQNQFAQTQFLGMTDQRYNYNSKSVQIDTSEAGVLYAGQAVKVVDSAGGIPKVIACSASTDQVWGFIQYDVKSRSYVAGDRCQIAQKGNVLFLRATGAIARGAQVTLDVSMIGGVASIAAPNRIVGFTLDKASAAGDLIRVEVSVPSYSVAS